MWPPVFTENGGVLTPLHLAIRFILELVALAAAGIVGASIGTPPFGLVGGIAAAVLFGVGWGLFLAPRARFPQPAMVRFVVGTAVLEVAAVALAIVAPGPAGIIVAMAILFNAFALLVTGAIDADKVFEPTGSHR